MAPYALLTIAFAAIAAYLVTRMVTGSLEERFTNQLAESARVTADSVVRRERQQVAAARGLAFTEGMSEAAAARDAGAVARLAAPYVANTRTEIVEVLDAQGYRLFGAELATPSSSDYTPLAEPGDRSAWSLVARVLNREDDALGDKFAEVVPLSRGYALYTSSPILDGDRLVGVVLVGSMLESFLPVAKSESLADITIYDGEGHPVATTFPAGDDEDADLTPGSGVIARAAGSAVREPRTLFGRDYSLVYGTLRVRNQPVGYYSVALPSDYIASAGSTARTQMTLLFGAITVTVLLVGWVLARKLTVPLSRLVETARAVSAGDLTARSRVSGADEIGVLAASFDAMTERLQRQHLATVTALTSAIDARDPYTAGHSLRVGQLSVEIGRALGMTTAQVQHLEIGGYLHDIGKIGVRDSILLKGGRLSPDQRELIERHPLIGLDILRPVELAPEVIAVVAGHHERLDGSGYPQRLQAGELTIFARIASVADVYDALSTDRPYRAALPSEEALAFPAHEAGAGRLDPDVVASLRQLAPLWEDRRRTDPALQGFRIERGRLRMVA